VGLSVYIHLPYCSQKCPYCDFNVHIVKRVPEADYCAALEREITHVKSLAPWSGRAISTVFFGGGTPSLFQPSSFGRLLESLDRCFGLDPDCEISLEANPDELADGSEYARDLRQAGITRLSLGVQSFDAAVLRALGRTHDADLLERSIEAATAANFQSISCDLIFAVPGQSPAMWAEDLEQATAAGFDHVSTYNLTYERGTPMTGLRDAGRIKPVDDEVERTLYEQALQHFAANGFERYEVSSFAKPGHRCRHNQNYWLWSDFLGLGAGAHGFARTRDRTSGEYGRRYENHRQPALYMGASDGAWIAWQESLDLEATVKEVMFTGLRRSEGVSMALLVDVLGPDALSHYPRLVELRNAGLVATDRDAIRLTHAGLLVADSVIESLVID